MSCKSTVLFKPLIAISLASFLNANSYKIPNNDNFTQDITTQSGESNITFQGSSGTLSCNVSANGGNNTINFTQSGSFAITGILIASNTSSNTLIIDKDITLTSDLTLGGSASGTHGNIINLTSGKLVLQNNQGLQSLNTQGGVTHLSFNVANQEFHGNINTTRGETKINFSETGAMFYGDITANGGNNTLTFSEGLVIFGDGLTNNETTLDAHGTSSNTLKIQANNIRLSGVLHLNGEKDSKNLFEFSQNSSLAFDTVDQDVVLETLSGNTEFKLAEGSSVSIEKGSAIQTNGGNLKINFLGTTGSFTGKALISSGGENHITFQKDGVFSFIDQLDAQGDAKTSGMNYIDITHNIQFLTSIISTSSSLSNNPDDRGSNLFVIGDEKTFKLISASGERQTLYTKSGSTTLEFSSSGSFIGNILTENGILDIYYKNRTSIGGSPQIVALTFDTNFSAQKNGINTISLNSNTNLKSKGELNFSSDSTGKNLLTIWGNNTSITLKDSASNQSQTLVNRGNMEITFIGEGQSFDGNFSSKSGGIKFILGGENDKNPQTPIIGKITIDGNISADGGNNTFSFAHDNSSFGMGSQKSLIANSKYSNTFTIDKDITFTSDLNLSGNAGGNGGNIFNISNEKNLALLDSSQSLKTFATSNGQSKVNFLGSGAILANISTIGGSASFVFQNTGDIGLDTKNTTISSSSTSINTFKANSLILHTSSLTSNDGGINEIYAPTVTFSGTTTISSTASQNSDARITFKTSNTGAGDLNITASNASFQVSGDGTADILIQTTGKLTLSASSLSASGSERNNITIFGSQQKQSEITLGSNGITSSGGSTKIAAHSLSNGGNITASNTGKNILSFSGNVDSGDLTSSGIAKNTLSIGGNATLGNISSSGGSNALTLIGGGSIGNISATGGENTFNLGSSSGSKTSPTLTTKGTYAATGGKNTFNLNANSYILDMQDAFSNALGLETNGGETIFDFNADNTQVKLSSITNTSGSTQINFKGENNTLTSSIATAADMTSITLSSGASGEIVGSITTSGSGANQVSFSQNSTLTLFGSSNTLNQITLSDTSTNAKLILDSQNNAITTTIDSSLTHSGLKIDFQGGGTDAQVIKLILNGSANLIPELTVIGTKNTLALTKPSDTIISKEVSVSGGIAFDIADKANLTFSKGITSNSNNGVVFNFAGASTVSGAILTSEFGALYGTIINLADSSDAIFSDSITTDIGGSSIVNFKSLKASKASLTLNGSINQISDFNILDDKEGTLKGKSIEINAFSLGDKGEAHFTLANSSTTISSLNVAQQGNTLTLDSTLNSASLSVTHKTPSNNLVLAFKSSTKDFTSEATLNGDGNKLYEISILSGKHNKLILSQGATSVVQQVNISTNQGLTFDLKDTVNLALSNHLTNSGSATLNFDNATLTSNITTNNTQAITNLNVLKNNIATITGNIVTTQGVSNAKINGTLKLQGADNSLTSVASSSLGILSLDGINHAVNANVENPIAGENITLNLKGDASKQTHLTLNSSGNVLKALTLGETSTNNKLTLSQGNTSIQDSVSIGKNQALTLDLKDSANLTLKNNLANAGNLNVAFDGNLSTLISHITTSGTTLFEVSSGKIGVIKGNIIISSGGKSNISLKTGTLKLQGTNNTITQLSGTTGTLSLDSVDNNVTASIEQTISGNSFELNFNGNQNHKAELTLVAGGNTITSITLGDLTNTDSVNNKLILSQGNTSMVSTPIVKANQALDIELGNSANFILSSQQPSTGTLSNSGKLSLDFKEGTATLTGSVTTNSNATTTLNLSGSISSIATFIGSLSTQGRGNFVLNAYATTSIFQYKDSKTLEFSSGNNIINLHTQNSKLYWKKYNGSDYVATDIYTKGSALTQINFNADSTLVSCMQTSGGSTEINIANQNKATLEGSIITSGGIANINLATNSTLTLNGSNKTLSTTHGISTIAFKGENGVFDGIITTSNTGELNINVESTKSGQISQSLSNSATTNITLQSSSALILLGGINTTGGKTTLSLKGTSNPSDRTLFTITKNLNTTGGSTELAFQDSNSALILKGESNTISSISSTLGNNNIISLSEGEAHDKRTEDNQRRQLTIESITQDSQPLTLISQTTATKADTFIINRSTTKTRNSRQPSTHSLSIVVANGIKLSNIGKSGEILVASVKNTSGTTPSIVFDSTSQVVSGFTTATAVFSTKQTDESGKIQENGNYTSYFIKSMQNAQVIAAEQEITATAFTLNYDLYMANFNSLNKRMGELRENPYSQGIWTRVFNGALSNDFGLKTKTNYTTIQAGYDYAFGSEGANNYLGFALSYALSTSTSEHAFDVNSQKRSIDSIYSNAIEVALYNSYVSDEGWYNDTIAKFSYLMSDFKINNITDPSNTTSTNNDTQNFALTLSDEVGYIFAVGENKEWGITPQLELGFGYFNQSDFKQTLENSGAFLQSNADSVLTLRARVGSSFSYDFKAFCNPKTFNASLYLGTFYEYDYVSGGEIKFRTDQITQDTANNLSHLQSDGRAILNVGTNMTIKESTRLYIDFEKSFAGKINTDYQINFGVRYSFGEGNYTPLPQPIEQKAPLKIEDTPNNNEQDKLQ